MLSHVPIVLSGHVGMSSLYNSQTLLQSVFYWDYFLQIIQCNLFLCKVLLLLRYYQYQMSLFSFLSHEFLKSLSNKTKTIHNARYHQEKVSKDALLSS